MAVQGSDRDRHIKHKVHRAAWIKAAVLALALFLAPLKMTAAYAADGREITCREDLNHEDVRVGVGQGGYAEQLVEKELPKARRMYMSNIDGYQSVAQGKVDAFVFERKQMELAIASGVKGVRLLDENMEGRNRVAVGISPVTRIDDLEGKLNDFIREKKADGTLDDMYERWVLENDETLPEIGLPDDPEYHLTVATTGIVPPFTYYKGTELNGYDIELAYRFAAWLGADLEFKVYDYAGVVAAALTGDVDCIMADLNVTPEREESIGFSNVLFEEVVGIMVKDDRGEISSFFGSVWDSFEKNFIREDRWKLFVYGMAVTLIITVLSVIFGTALGFGVFMLCKDGNPVANRITDHALWLIQGMPVVVLLMILYYIIFGSIDINGVIVSVIAFTLTFGSGVYGLLQMGVGAVDPGQYEAASALGYSVNHAFFRIILPQAVPHVMDAYKGQIVALIKATAIVGYIAVQDLTKTADIVRSRTYDAFFPLIAIAVIYFLLEMAIGVLVSRVCIRMDPKRRRKGSILKGVDVHDKD